MMSAKHLIATLISAGALVAGVMGLAMPAHAQPAPGEEASIPFANRDGITDYKADGDRGLYIRSANGEWYYARTMAKCGRLRDAITVGFETATNGELDRKGALVAQGWRCPLESLVRSDAPPKKAKSRG